MSAVSNQELAAQRRALNAAVKMLASTDRKAAEQILAKYNVMNTAVLPAEHWQAVHDACVKAMEAKP